MQLAAGDHFGRYQVDGLLGQGGMATVFRATDTLLQRPVALKLVRVDVSGAGPSATLGAAHLLHEARAAARFEHVNAVSIFDVGQVGDAAYIAMELVNGRSLRSFVGDETIPMATRIRWLRDVARALGAAHASGLVHRDVKPENVMVRDDGTVKVLDFGISWLEGTRPPLTPAERSVPRDVVRAWRSTLTRGGALAGTPVYMSPEHLRGEAIDARADQFSWGVMAYELLAGSLPWRGDTTSLTTLHEIMDARPAPLRQVARASRHVCAVIERAMQKDPADRFASMEAVAAELEKEGRAGPRRRIRVAVAATLAVLAAGATIAWRAARTAATAAVPRTVVRLDASRGVTLEGRAVVKWADQSGAGNDAVAGATPPTLLENAILGRAAIHFDGAQYLSIADAPALHFGTGDFVVEVVARHDRPASDPDHFSDTTSYGVLYAKTSATRPWPGIGLFTNFRLPVPSTRFGAQTSWYDFVSSTSDGLNDGKPHLTGLRRHGPELILTLDGKTQTRISTTPPDDVSALGQPAWIGGHLEDGEVIQRLQGDIAEIVVIDGSLPSTEFSSLEWELMQKYGL